MEVYLIYTGTRILISWLAISTKKRLKIMSCNTTMEDLKDFLDQFRVNRGQRGDPFTHVTKSRPEYPAGSFYISTEYVEGFLTYYSNAIRAGFSPSVAERPGAYGPLRVDFDFTANLDVGLKRQYDVDILKKIVGLSV